MGASGTGGAAGTAEVSGALAGASLAICSVGLAGASDAADGAGVGSAASTAAGAGVSGAGEGACAGMDSPRTFARIRSATASSIELECVFFPVTPSSGSISRMTPGFTSSSRASSLMRILLIPGKPPRHTGRAFPLLPCTRSVTVRLVLLPLDPWTLSYQIHRPVFPRQVAPQTLFLPLLPFR